MRIQIHFNNMTKSEAINDYVLDKLDLLCGKLHIENPEVDVYLNIVRARTDYRQPLFSCEILIKTEFDKNYRKVIKQEEDLYKAITETMRALTGTLSKRMSRKHDHHRHERRVESLY